MAKEGAEHPFDISILLPLLGVHHVEHVNGERNTKYTPNSSPSRKVSQNCKPMPRRYRADYRKSQCLNARCSYTTSWVRNRYPVRYKQRLKSFGGVYVRYRLHVSFRSERME